MPPAETDKHYALFVCVCDAPCTKYRYSLWLPNVDSKAPAQQ